MAITDAPKCTAKAKRTGNRCRNAAVRGKKVCRMHGGKSPSGIASASFKTGRYSKALPEHLLSRYADALADPGLTDLSDELALTDTRLGELLGQLGDDEATLLDLVVWKEAAGLIEQRRKLVDTERKRLADASQMVPAAEVLALVRSLVSLVREHVTDKAALAAIHTGVSGLLDRPRAQA